MLTSSLDQGWEGRLNRGLRLKQWGRRQKGIKVSCNLESLTYFEPRKLDMVTSHLIRLFRFLEWRHIFFYKT